MEFISHSVEETENFAYELASKITAPKVICLTGDLGAGKTAFTRGFARYFGIEKGVSSPTFIIMHRYEGSEIINHYDLYRLSDFDELLDIGFEEQIESGISIIEWPDNFMEFLPDDKIVVRITRLGDNERKITYEHTCY
ncbi:MAG: tRNA (adenosine(37)-N6)-threonylcarbamoyltransferase complex ATPase subunit type 1 TsaE [Clostridia bacterium]|nr:tRNA (adenosine(37)-N6)-threonylcarbamoyltransferase complex ATPase subunit type 1 TsaE [Clostridia bacterium]